MSTTAITTIIKMMERLSDDTQDQVVSHVREYLADIADETEWNKQFVRSQEQLSAAAQQARQEYLAGNAQPMDFDRQ